MNAESFAQYLQNPSMLYQASYQELKSLSLLYPYCQNIHLLLLQKSYLEGLPEWGQHLHKAASYSIDRTFLYHLMKQMDAKTPETESFLLEEEYLELKSLAEMETEMEWLERPGLDAEPGRPPQSLDAAPLPASGFQEEEEEEFDLSFGLGSAVEKPGDAAPATERLAGDELLAVEKTGNALADDLPVSGQAAPPALLMEEAISLAVAVASILPVQPIAAPSPAAQAKAPQAAHQFASPQLAVLKQTPRRASNLPEPPSGQSFSRPAVAPQPKNTFSSWVEQFQPPHIKDQLGELMESRKMEEGRKKNKRAKSAAKNTPEADLRRHAISSITENEEIATETLAELLCAQGFQDKAVEMYRRLMLVFPEKSSYFAAKIENLKNK